MIEGLNNFFSGSEAVDGHAHVFVRTLPMAAERRYTPLADASFDAYGALLFREGLSGGVLVQPSFLGMDNRHLLEVLRRARDDGRAPRLRGVCVLSPTASPQDIRKMADIGVVGARLNLLGRRAPDLRSATWRNFLSAVDAAGWHLEICAEGVRLPEILAGAMARCRAVVIDHFGLPDPAEPLKCRGFRKILRSRSGQLRVKISAPYRVFPGLPLDLAADRCAELSRVLRDQLGARRLIWGSDWPWTRHESGMTYAATLRWRQQWLDNEQDGAADLLN